MKRSLSTLFALSILLIFVGCSSMQVTEESVANQSVAGVSISSKSTATQAVLANAVVYFEYDKFNLTAKSIQALKGVSDLMQRNLKITLSIEGHADERGTREYNLALGQRRAESVANYLIANGVTRNRLKIEELSLNSFYLDENFHCFFDSNSSI